MQQNLVQSNGASIHQTGEEEMYEFDVSECLLRLRWGRMLAITQERFGQVVSAYSVSISAWTLSDTGRPARGWRWSDRSCYMESSNPSISYPHVEANTMRSVSPISVDGPMSLAHTTLGSEKLTETIITLIRAKFLQPTAPELQILRSDQQERRFIVRPLQIK